MQIKAAKNLLTAALFVAVLFAGTLGFYLVEDGWSWFDAFYMTVISVTTVGYGEVRELSTAGRVVAMAVLICGLGIFGLVAAQIAGFVVNGELGGVFERKRTQRLVSQLRDHLVVCGLGARGAWIARSALVAPKSEDRGRGLTAVELDRDVDVINELRRAGSVVVNGNARDLDVLETVGVSTAGQIVVVAGDDQNNLAIARDIRTALEGSRQKPSIIAAVEKYETRSYFADRVAKLGISLMGFREQAALCMAQRLTLDLVGDMGALPIAPIHIAVEASDQLRDEIVRALVMVCQITGGERLQLHLFGATEDSRQRFMDSFPDAGLCAEITWSGSSMESHPSDLMRPDIAIIARSSDDESLYAADRFLLRRPAMAANRVVACIQDTGDLRKLAAEPDPYKRQPLVLSLYEVRRDAGAFVAHAMEPEAKALHESYRSAAPQANDPGAWEEISDFLRNSNRLAALHQPIKKLLWDRLCAESLDEQKILHHLSVSEHMRWVAFHVMNGWRLAEDVVGNRDERSRSRRHHCLVPYEALDAATKEYDLRVVLQALGLPANFAHAQRVVAHTSESTT